MKKASEYREHAEECRRLATTMDGEQRDQLLQMAENWDLLAGERARFVAKENDSFAPDATPACQNPRG
jgi:hypothetical protein